MFPFNGFTITTNHPECTENKNDSVTQSDNTNGSCNAWIEWMDVEKKTKNNLQIVLRYTRMEKRAMEKPTRNIENIWENKIEFQSTVLSRLPGRRCV